MATTIGRGPVAMRVRTLKPTNSFADYPKKAGIQEFEETGFSAAQFLIGGVLGLLYLRKSRESLYNVGGKLRG